jgi:hypothetical protein
LSWFESGHLTTSAAGGDVLGEGDLGAAPLFLDDLISSGQTRRRCEDAIANQFYGGLYTYELGEYLEYE